MIRVLIDLAVDTDDEAGVRDHVEGLIETLGQYEPDDATCVRVARADVTASPDPDQASADMVEAFRGAGA